MYRDLENHREAILKNPIVRIRQTTDIDALADAIHTCITSARPCYALWSKVGDQSTVIALYDAAREQIDAYNALRRKISGSYETEIFSIDVDAMYLRFKSEYTSIFRFLKSQYWADKKRIQSLSLERGKKLTDNEIFELLGALRRLAERRKWMDENSTSLSAAFGELYQAEHTNFDLLKQFLDAYALMRTCLENLDSLRKLAVQNEEQASVLQQHYESLYSGLETDWNTVRQALDWAVAFYKSMDGAEGYGEAFLHHVCASDEKIALCKTYSIQIKQTLDKIAPDLKWFLALFELPDEWQDMPLSPLTQRLTRCADHMAALEEWIDFRTVRSQCYDLGLEGYICQIEALHIDAPSIVPVFQKRFLRLWLDSVLPEYPVVANFRRKNQEAVIQEFDRLDKLQFAIARSRVRSRLINDLPSLDHFTSGVDEISTLKRELNKQRRIMPVRRLFREIPNLILALKPCLMMSPLSVSLFLEADTFTFDTVIFDEASQVCTENAIGAILRGKQVVIAGDSKQLPPTTVFSASVSDSDFDEGRQEAFFVKSLENVQGDERDTIIFSIGYAKDASGVMRMNFGPLSKTGGERRLNVAITRAKYSVKLVGSILPTDIDTERVSSDGPKLLRGYIDFAMNGPSALQDEITKSDFVQHDSPFETAVYDFLDRKGYKLATQVGCSGCRIDMAVRHPKLSGRYVLGIECDEVSYHAGFAEIPARQANGRNIKHISIDELAAAMLRVLSKCVGTTRLALIDETTRALGFNRRGANITKAMNEAFDSLAAQGRITESDGKIIRADV